MVKNRLQPPDGRSGRWRRGSDFTFNCKKRNQTTCWGMPQAARKVRNLQATHKVITIESLGD